MVIDEFAEGEQSWKFVFDYDIVSLPEYEKKAALAVQLEQQKEIQKRKK